VSRPLNFLHLSTFYPPYSFGGDGIQIYRLAHALADAGHHVDVVHCEDAYHLLHPGEPNIQFPEHPGVHRHGLRSGYGKLSPLITQQTGRPWLKAKKITELLRSRRYDVIHFHNISLLGPQILSIRPQEQVLKVYTAHEHWLVCPTHVLWKFNRAVCDKPECLRCTLQSGRPPQLWRYTGLLTRAAQNVDRFFGPSRFTLRMHAERGFPKPLLHLPNFIDRVDHEWQTSQPRPHERPYFFFAGRLEVIKGVDALISLWPRVAEGDLLIAGTGSQEFELRAMAAGNPRIRFLGALSPSELGSFYRHALACIVPSITYETFGLTSIEAFARKTPAIVRDLGALPEVIEDSGGGFVFRTDEELLEAINRIALSRVLRDELGQRGYDAFLRLWTREAHLAAYFEFLNIAAAEKFNTPLWR
jgi:glycosyltransferase involved in cell wall biosynthesis